MSRRPFRSWLSWPRWPHPALLLVSAIVVAAPGSAALAASPTAASSAAPGASEPYLEDVTAASGVDFRHWNGRTGALDFPEMTGQGAALFDYDGDGDLDLYLVQGNHLRPSDRGKTLEPPPDANPKDRLYRNLGVRQGVPRFEDVTEASGIAAHGYGMGVAIGDLDNDGHPDLYLANYGPDQLWRNRGDGTFEDWTSRAGIAGKDDGWSVGAVFFDYDADGLLDLFVIDYVQYSLATTVRCFANSSRRDYCGPAAFRPAANRLYRNLGEGRFEERTLPAGLAGSEVDGASLGVVAEDFDGDGDLDLYVANDGQPNNLWLNSGGETPTFQDEALLAGVALNREGQPEASMGVAVGDVDGDGRFDLFMTHLMGETNTLYLDQGGALYEDRTIEMGLAANSMGFTSFGTGFLDLENDGWLDLYVASGAVKLLEEGLAAGDTFPLGQPNQLFHNQSARGGRRFVDVSQRGGSSFALLEVGRGAAFGDLDGDGDTDVVSTNNHGPARLLLSRQGQAAKWIGLRLRELASRNGRDALGATAELELAPGTRGQGPRRWLRRAATDGSYSSANDPRLIFGLGIDGASLDPKSIVGVRVRWADGQEERFPAPAVGRYTELVRGEGKPAKP